MAAKDRPQGNGDQIERDTHVHSPEGERGEGNPRRPQPDPQRDGDVRTPGVKEPKQTPPQSRSAQGEPSEPEKREDDTRRHEADPPQPARRENEDVPPYAGDRPSQGAHDAPPARQGGQPTSGR
jgi:hypothetical protein